MNRIDFKTEFGAKTLPTLPQSQVFLPVPFSLYYSYHYGRRIFRLLKVFQLVDVCVPRWETEDGWKMEMGM